MASKGPLCYSSKGEFEAPFSKGHAMPENAHIYALSCRIGRDFSQATIERGDGESVGVPAQEIGSLLCDMAVDDDAREGKRAHHLRVLGEWFEAKRAKVRLVLA